MSNHEKLKKMIMDVFLIKGDDYRLSLKRDDIPSWDSLGVVSLSVGIQQTFGHHLKPQEMLSLKSVQDIIDVLNKKGVKFDD